MPSSFRQKLEPLFSAIDHFLRKPAISNNSPPFVRDHFDVKRMMVLVVIALFPCTLAAIWNTGMQAFVYNSQDNALYQEYLRASSSLSNYFTFAGKEHRYLSILWMGLKTFLPILFTTYLIGGIWEVIFAVIRKKEIAEGFLVTGILYALILPATLPLWMVAIGVSFGVVIGKEIFGGTGRNLLNPALTCRVFLYFAFPAYMTGEVWVAPTSYSVTKSIQEMTSDQPNNEYDAITQSSALSFYNLPHSVKKIHIDAIALGMQQKVQNGEVVATLYNKWQKSDKEPTSLSDMKPFVTSEIEKGGLGMGEDLFSQAVGFTKLKYGLGLYSNGNLFFGNRIGSMGEVSILASLLGAALLLLTGIASFRTMAGFALGMILTALFFQMIGAFGGLFMPASFDFPFYKQFLMGGAMFGLVFMATDPVSSPGLPLSRWIYGLMIGIMVIVIRILNPAYPEGVMLAILLGNVFAPLLDHVALKRFRKKRLYV